MGVGCGCHIGVTLLLFLLSGKLMDTHKQTDKTFSGQAQIRMTISHSGGKRYWGGTGSFVVKGFGQTHIQNIIQFHD
jgi:hypothetical protein